MRRDISLHDCSCSYDAAFTYMRISEYCDIRSNPATLFYDDRSMLKSRENALIRKSMIVIIDCDPRTEYHMIFNRYFLAANHNTITIKRYIRTNGQYPPHRGQ